MNEADQFIRDVAELDLDGEIDSEGREVVWVWDDAWSTLHALIERARAIEMRQEQAKGRR